MNLYLITQSVNDDYDTYDAAVVVAEDEEEARNTHPSNQPVEDAYVGTWCNAEDVEVQYLGTADGSLEKGVVCGSFNAG